MCRHGMIKGMVIGMAVGVGMGFLLTPKKKKSTKLLRCAADLAESVADFVRG